MTEDLARVTTFYPRSVDWIYRDVRNEVRSMKIFTQREAGDLADFAQMTLNSHNPDDMRMCPWPADAGERPPEHVEACQTCRVRAILTPGWFLKPIPPLRLGPCPAHRPTETP